MGGALGEGDGDEEASQPDGALGEGDGDEEASQQDVHLGRRRRGRFGSPAASPLPPT